MEELRRQVAGLQTCLIRDSAPPKLTIVFLHGYAMRAADLTPFAHSIAISGAAYVFPQAPLAVPGGGHAWWLIDEELRLARSGNGSRDLAEEKPPGRAAARTVLCELLAAVAAEGDGSPLLLAGFSQGGMLACDTVLLGGIRVAGLALMSASCMAMDEWTIHRDRLCGLRGFVSHGRADTDLAFAAGERLKNFLSASGAVMSWSPFDGGHEIPFAVWRQFRNFARDIMRAQTPSNEKAVHHGTH